MDVSDCGIDMTFLILVLITPAFDYAAKALSDMISGLRWWNVCWT